MRALIIQYNVASADGRRKMDRLHSISKMFAAGGVIFQWCSVVAKEKEVRAVYVYQQVLSEP